MSAYHKDETACHTVISEMLGMWKAWHFVKPVNPMASPTYKKVTKQPMDLTTIKKILESSTMKSSEDFVYNVHLIFSDCELFKLGIAGYSMRSHFEAKSAKLTSI